MELTMKLHETQILQQMQKTCSSDSGILMDAGVVDGQGNSSSKWGEGTFVDLMQQSCSGNDVNLWRPPFQGMASFVLTRAELHCHDRGLMLQSQQSPWDIVVNGRRSVEF